MKIKVRVPATSANLGPGFDVFGLAINIHNSFTVELASKFEIISNNINCKLPENKENLFYQSFAHLFNHVGKRIPPVKITMDLRILHGRGLGSSATAVVGGLVAANYFLKNILSKEELINFAIELEKGQHPDNVMPALLGGLIVASKHESKFVHAKIPFPSDIKAVFLIPDFIMDTVAGRKLMPTYYARNDVVFNTGRIALLLAALQTKRYDLLKIAMQDKIHQPVRSKLFPLIPKLIEAANNAGALGSALSGGGSSIISLADSKFEEIGLAMQNMAKKHGVVGKIGIFDISNEGVTVETN